MLALFLVLALLVVAGRELGSQEAALRPLAEYLEQSGAASQEVLRYATQRCSALFSLVAEERQRRGDAATAEMYTGWSIGFQVYASRSALASGRSTREALQANRDAITEIRERLAERLSRLVYIADDPLLSEDVPTCRDLVDELDL